MTHSLRCVAVGFWSLALSCAGVVASSGGYTAGTPWTGQPGVTETIADIMAREAARGPQVGLGARELKPRLVRNARGLPQNPKAPPTRRWAESDRHLMGRASSAALGPQTPGTNFLGAQLSDSGYVPPDSMGDVGPSQFLVCVNGRIRVFDRNGTMGPLNTTTDSFFGSETSFGTSDPHVRYDRLSQRWFVVMIDVPGSQKNNKVLIAVSSGPTITGNSSFTFFSFKPKDLSTADNNLFVDYPTLGIDNNALYIGANLFNGHPFGTFSHTSGYVVRKSDLLSGALTVTAFSELAIGSGAGPVTPQGVDNDDSIATEGYFIGVDNAMKGRLVMRRVTDPGGAPSISGNLNITVPATENPMGGVVAQGATTPLDDVDDRLYQARIHNGSLWTAHNIEVNSGGVASASGGRDGSRWYEIINVTGTPTLRQAGTLYDSSASNPSSYWIPTCAVSGQGHMSLGCSVAGVNQHAEIAVAGRFEDDPLGTLQTPAVVQFSSFIYNVNDGRNPHRWGDYSATSVDPNDDMTFWTVQEYCNANNSWGVRVIQLKAPPPAVPVGCSPASISAGSDNVEVVVTGSVTNGSGFFDPGPAYPNHISASVDGGGVTVNSVTYNNPTNVTLQLSVAAEALSGTRTVTVTNPDGQSVASGIGILTINGLVPSNSPPELPAITDRIIVEGALLTFTNTANDPDFDLLTYTLAGAPPGAGVTNDGVFSWTPDESQGPGTNVISMIVTDNGSPSLSATQIFTVFVLETNNFAPVLASVADRLIYATTTLIITNSATDDDLPANTLTYSLDPGAPAAASIEASTGIFSWAPEDADASTTNSITVRVTDDGTPSLSDTQSFSVTVIGRPAIEHILLSNNVPTLDWTAIPGQGYRLQYTLQLENPTWLNVIGDVIATNSSASKTDPEPTSTNRFYRVRVLP